jgi:thioredoxin 1
MKRNWLRVSVALALAVTFAIGAGCATNSKDAKKPAKAETKQLPKLLELGSTKCIPCKAMAPILEQLAKDYKGQLEVQFIDVWKDTKAAEKYGIKSIPTQVFYDAKGKEFFRHIGYFPKEDILKTFEKQGIKLKKPADPKKPEGKK